MSHKLKLFRDILRAHRRKLDGQMRQLGDTYVKTEWKLHKGVKNQRQIDKFMIEWKQYFTLLGETADLEVKLKSTDPLKNRMTNLNNDQQQQLDQLKKELFTR